MNDDIEMLADLRAKATWECFVDHSYYDMWAVRQVGEIAFNSTFHLVNGDEAKALVALLNSTAAPVDGGKDA